MAQFATKGTGNMRDYICWFDWSGTTVANGASKTFTTPDGLIVKVTFSNVSGSPVVPFVMNTWSGAILWQLYDFTNPSVMPALFSQNTINSVNFTMNISVTRAGVPTPFTFVTADAEASAASEITTINTNGSPWRTIEFYRNSNQTSNPLSGCGTQAVKLTLTYGGAPQTGQNPILATDANGSLVINTAMNRQEQGGMALAFGIFAPVDRGDLPSPYPQVQHGLGFTTTNSCNFNPPFPSIVQDASLRLGIMQGDADGAQTTDDNAVGVDEDAISSFLAYDGRGSYTLPLTLSNITGSLAFLTGWFDYNRDGNFSSNESVSVTVPNGATSASLTWTGLPTNLPQGGISGFAFRFRLSSNAAEAQSVGGYARDGEVEDYLIDQEVIQDQSVKVSFTTPDTVCVNTPVNITNTTTGASSYYWNFCVADVNMPPTGFNMGNVGGKLNTPVYIDYVYDNGNYYGFVTNNYPGGLLRLDFGNSLLNTPTVTDLGMVGGIIPYNTEGIQIVKNEDKWYLIIVGGDNVQTVPNPAAIVKIELGTNIANNSPVGTSWGNIGNLAYPHDLYVFDDNGHWYGLTVNTDNSTITKFDFTTSFSNTPSAVNLGNIGNLNSPTGIYALQDNGNWYAFVTNANNSSLTRLDFGSSLLNTPTGVNLGNIGGQFNTCWDIQIMKYCGQNVGFVINAADDLIKLDFGNNIKNTPTASSFGNTGSLNFPHCLSKLFRVGSDLYTFVTNVNNNTITRIRFTGCTNSSIPSSTAKDPAAITYNTPGTYNINLTVDDGLPTQAAFCKQVVVLGPPTHSPTKNLTVCPGGSTKIGSPVKPANYLWSTGEKTDSIIVNKEGTYWVESERYGCSVRDSFIVTYSHLPLDFGFQQDMCSPKTIQFKGILPGVQSYLWDFGNGQTNGNTLSPVITYDDYGSYNIKMNVKYNGTCVDSLAKSIILENIFDDAVVLNNDTTICLGDSVLLKTIHSISNYCWRASAGVVPISLNTYLKPAVPTTYILTSQIVGSNLVTNPDFSSGNAGFTSEYNYANPNVTEGEYYVASSSIAWNQYMASCHDHTTGGGNMMVINGSPVAGVKVWSQSFPVKPNANYNFSVWISSLHINNPAKLHFAINNVELGNDINAGSSTCQWKQFFSTWNSGSSTSATISIVNNNTIVDGNDFALDDIFFGEVTTKTDSFNVNVIGLCDSVKIMGVDKVCSSSDTLTYSIYKSPNCTQLYSMQVDNAYADIVSQTPTSLKLLFKKNGTTTIKVAYANNCKIVADSLNVAIKFSPTSINFGPDVITCRDTSLVLNAGDGFVSYTWQDGSKDSTFITNTPGSYNVIAQNLCGLQLKDTIKFIKSSVTPFTVFPLSATVCKGDSLQFKANGGTSYSWSPPGNFSKPNAAFTKALIDATQDLNVYISDSICRRDTTFVIPVIASPNANITVSKSNDVNCGNDSAILIANGGVSYTWSPNLYIARNNGNRITVKPYQNITYTVRGKDETGCSGQDSVTVYFFKEGNQKLFMPTAFTPNGDGVNDVFRPTFIGPSAKYDFSIYSRWGQLVFRSKVPGIGWDGTVNGIPQKGDVYVFYITAEGGCNGKFVQKGTFALIR